MASNTMRLTLLPALLLASASTANAQWSCDPTTNLAVSDAAGDQVQPKVAPTSDGGAYVSWFDSISNGFDLRLQRLDAQGVELWSHGGVLVLDRSFSSTQDYGLDVDVDGNALLVARDDSGAGVQITASQVSPSGTLLWGAGGITLTNTTGFVAAPKIAGTSDGGAVVAWSQDASAMLQKLDASGTTLWGGGLSLTPAAGTYAVSDLHDSGTDAILSMVHQTGAFFSPKHLLAQKFDAAGNPLWGAAPVGVFDSGSLQFGNFPPFTPDGSGGALFAWYGTSPLQVYAQHVRSSGAEAFPHNGVAGSTNTSRVRVSPSVAYDASTGATYMFWTEQNSGQSQSGLWGQRFDAVGNRQWGNTGAAFVPLGSPQVLQVRAQVSGDGAFAFWVRVPSFGADELHGAHVDGGGSLDIEPFEVSSTPSGKSRLDTAVGSTGQMLLAWSDQRVDSGDVLAQNVNPDGSLGPLGVGTVYCDANPDNSSGICIDTSSCTASSINVCLNGAPAGQFAYLLIGAGSGTLTDPPGAAGDLCLGGAPLGRYTSDAGAISASGHLSTDLLNASSGGGGGGIPNPPGGNVCSPAGQTWNFQYWHRNGPNPSGFSKAISVTFN